MNHETARALTDKLYTEGPLAPHQDEALRIHLRSCDDCREHYDELGAMEVALGNGEAAGPMILERMMARGAPAPKVEGVSSSEVDDQANPAVQTEPVNPGSPKADTAHDSERVGRGPLFAAVLAVAAVVLAVILLRPQPPDDDYTGIRSGETSGRTEWFTAYRAKGDDIEPLKGSLHPQEGLLFSYSTTRETKARYLAIAGLDSKNKAHWYHPAYTSADEDPRSIPIFVGKARVELSTRIRADHAPGPLKICAMFTAEPLSVRKVDPALESKGRWPKGAQCVTVEVKR